MPSYSCVTPIDHHVLDDAAAGASECRRCLILRGFEAGDALLERGELDHDEAMEVVRSFVDVIPAAARQDLPPCLAMIGGTRSVYFLDCTGSVIFARATQ